MKPAESDYGAVVVAYLQALGAEVFQEVDVPGGVADIVARVQAELWIIEVKTSLSLALLIQAMERRRLAHRVILAAPPSRNARDVAGICAELGVGLWLVSTGYESWDPPWVREEVPSRRWNARPVALAGKLREEHKTHAQAGAVGGGGRWTPFRGTCEALAEAARRTPGIALKAAIGEIKHHYRSASSARSSLATWLRQGKVPGVVMRDGALFPAEPEET